MRLNKNQLNILGTTLGAIAGIASVLGSQNIISPRIAGAVGGCATVLLGVVVQRPATSHPTTEDVEEHPQG